MRQKMKVGEGIEYFTQENPNAVAKWHKGILLQFSEIVCRILPKGRKHSIVVPTSNVRGCA